MNTYLLQQQKDLVEIVAKKVIDITFKDLSCLADDLLKAAEDSTETRSEYVAFLKGAAFLFYKICKRDDKEHTGQSKPIETPQDAINHCINLFPFMTKNEQKEHLKLIRWLNELLIYKGDSPVELPQEILKDKD